MTYGPPCPFRACGYTWQAGFYPLSPDGVAVIAEHNGVLPGQLPRGALNAASAGMLAWIEALGAARAAGRPARDPDGRWHTMARLAA